MEAAKLLYSKREAADLLSLSVRALDSLIFSQRLSTCRLGRRVLIPKDSLELIRQALTAPVERNDSRSGDE